MITYTCLSVDVGDPRLGSPTDLCQGFAIVKIGGAAFDPGGSGPEGGSEAIADDIGAAIAAGGTQLVFYDYFYDATVGSVIGRSDPGNWIAVAYLLSPFNSTSEAVGGDCQPYIIVKEPDESQAAAGLVWPFFFMVDDDQSRLFQFYCLNASCGPFVWLPNGGTQPSERSGCADISGYNAQGDHGVITSSNYSHTNTLMQLVFPFPGFDLFNNPITSNIPNGGPYPVCLTTVCEGTYGNAPTVTLVAQQPENTMDVIQLITEYESSRGVINNSLTDPGGCLERRNACGNPLSGVGAAGVLGGYDKCSTSFYCLCNPAGGIWEWNGTKWVCIPITYWNGTKWVNFQKFSCWDGSKWAGCGCGAGGSSGVPKIMGAIGGLSPDLTPYADGFYTFP